MSQIKGGLFVARVLSTAQVIIMSATMRADLFSTYMDNAPVYFIEGRTFPVELLYAPASVDDYLHATLVAIFQLHREKPIKFVKIVSRIWLC
jgi:HrpA-like RNA helicase